VGRAKLSRFGFAIEPADSRTSPKFETVTVYHTVAPTFAWALVVLTGEAPTRTCLSTRNLNDRKKLPTAPVEQQSAWAAEMVITFS
jgi:hypothetical protein